MDRTDLLVLKDDIRSAKVVQNDEPAELDDGMIRLQIDKFALTANTITYAVYGQSFGYWGFYPTEDPWGRVPTWGFGSVIESRNPAFPKGERFYGLYPMSSHVTMRPEATSLGFKDAMPHREKLPKAYNHYASTAKDPVYDAEHEDEQMILRPLFVTSFLANDFFEDRGFFGAKAVAISSASSKTGYGLAFLIAKHSPDIEVIGLTSRRNKAFTQGLGCYETVLSYEEVGEMQKIPTALVDISGSSKLRVSVKGRLETDLVYAMALGDTHWQEDKPQLDKATAEFFFAPKWLAKRAEDWGMGGYVEKLAESWKALADPLSTAMQIRRSSGAEALVMTYLAHAEGAADPRIGDVISLLES